MRSFDTGMSLPRFLQFIDLSYLLEGTRLTNEQFDKMVLEASDDDRKRNINITRQNIMRSIFISSFSILEQNLDEIVQMQSKFSMVDIRPNDLKDRGINRSITYAEKVLKMRINTEQKHWQMVFQLQKLRNHLVHYGSTFSESKEHEKLWNNFYKLPYISMTDSINFTYENVETIVQAFKQCIRDFNEAKRKNA
ncbi:hypothetical protein [Vibrio metschnikovii]|uniref:hypothetical protein n=1 Tax=Vibrio metschnikovii TaxID=28172 RepID=UPI002FC7DDCF